jgi:phosphatidylglycerol:prolipoprotein diacylglycerol transferase
MINYPNIDPVIFKFGPVSLRWYGLAYAAGFSIAYILVKHQLRTMQTSSTELDIENLFIYLIVGSSWVVGVDIFYFITCLIIYIIQLIFWLSGRGECHSTVG